ncbi:hypothetical protein Sango_1397900 [Sesamum angolense]|uniref:Uncharacterized protein n=1 Tax=Sesamum angolense TaxID=2727404 RepID=A0AAE1WTY1_9LAMI|nr:hypothetical protein Sango_1397900 [Sesamum angolense]
MGIRPAIVLAGALLLLSLAQLAIAIANANSDHKTHHFIVKGHVFCDYCRGANVPNKMSKPMPRAEVKLECKDSYEKGKVTYSVTDIITDDDGKYEIPVEGDHKAEYCVVELVKSSKPDCADIVRDSWGRKPVAEVTLTDTDDLHPTNRIASKLSFSPKERSSQCGRVFRESDEEDDYLPPVPTH